MGKILPQIEKITTLHDPAVSQVIKELEPEDNSREENNDFLYDNMVLEMSKYNIFDDNISEI